MNVRLQLSTRRDATVIAGPAVQRNQDGTYAWVVKSDGTAEVRPIRIEAIEGDIALVAGARRNAAPGARRRDREERHDMTKTSYD